MKEELATLDQICAVYVPEGVETTTFSSIVRYHIGEYLLTVSQETILPSV